MAAKTDNRALQTAAQATTQKGAPPIPTILPAVETPQEKAAQRQPEGVHRTPAARPPRAGGVQTPQEKAAALPTTPEPGPVAGAPAIPTMLPTVPTGFAPSAMGGQDEPGRSQPEKLGAAGIATPPAGPELPAGLPGGELPPGAGGYGAPTSVPIPTGPDEPTGAPTPIPEPYDWIPDETADPDEKPEGGIHPGGEPVDDLGMAPVTDEMKAAQKKKEADQGNPHNLDTNPTEYYQWEIDHLAEQNEDEKQAELDAVEQSIKLEQQIQNKAIMDRLSGMGGGGEKSVTFTLGVLAAKTNGAIAEAQATIRKQYRDQEFERFKVLNDNLMKHAIQDKDIAAAQQLAKDMEQAVKEAEHQNKAETKPEDYIQSLGADTWDTQSKAMITDAGEKMWRDYEGYKDENGNFVEGHGDLVRYNEEMEALLQGIVIMNDPLKPTSHGGEKIHKGPAGGLPKAWYGMPKPGTHWDEWTLEQKKRLAKHFNQYGYGKGVHHDTGMFETWHWDHDVSGNTFPPKEWGIVGYDGSMDHYLEGHGKGYKASAKYSVDDYDGTAPPEDDDDDSSPPLIIGGGGLAPGLSVTV